MPQMPPMPDRHASTYIGGQVCNDGFVKQSDPIEMGQKFLEPFQILVELRGKANAFFVTLGPEKVKDSVDENPGRVNAFVYVY